MLAGCFSSAPRHAPMNLTCSMRRRLQFHSRTQHQSVSASLSCTARLHPSSVPLLASFQEGAACACCLAGMWEARLCSACRKSAVLCKSEPEDLAHQMTLCHLSPDISSCISFPLSSPTGWDPRRKDSVSLFFGSWLVISSLSSWSLQFHSPSCKVTSEWAGKHFATWDSARPVLPRLFTKAGSTLQFPLLQLIDLTVQTPLTTHCHPLFTIFVVGLLLLLTTTAFSASSRISIAVLLCPSGSVSP